MEAAISSLAGSRAWVIEGPRFVNETLEPESPEDYPIQTVGGYLELFSAWPPWGNRLPREIDKAQLTDVESVIDAMIIFSKGTAKEIAFELDGTQVGWISNGEPDRGIREGVSGAQPISARSNKSFPTATRAEPAARRPGARHAREPLPDIESCFPSLHPLNIWSLRETPVRSTTRVRGDDALRVRLVRCESVTALTSPISESANGA